jgi:Holliday junction resolvase RusA-like endonuclease
MITFELPWPPSVNHYYRHVGPRVLISKQGRVYRDVVAARIRDSKVKTFGKWVVLEIQLYPPDRRRRDIDNVLKCILDTLTVAELYNDDSQVKFLSVEKLEPLPPEGMVVLTIKEYSKCLNYRIRTGLRSSEWSLVRCRRSRWRRRF